MKTDSFGNSLPGESKEKKLNIFQRTVDKLGCFWSVVISIISLFGILLFIGTYQDEFNIFMGVLSTILVIGVIVGLARSNV